jgi:hypothetical protein
MRRCAAGRQMKKRTPTTYLFSVADAAVTAFCCGQQGQGPVC